MNETRQPAAPNPIAHAHHHHAHNHAHAACHAHTHAAPDHRASTSCAADMAAAEDTPQAAGERFCAPAPDERVCRFRVPDMDCPVEAGVIRARLAGAPGVAALDFNFMSRVLTVRHTLDDPAPIAAALAAVGMPGELLDEAGPAISAACGCDLAAAPAIPWKRLVVAGCLAALSEGAELVHEWHDALFDAPAWTLGGWPVLAVLSLVLALLAIALAGLVTYRKGWIAIANRTLNINALMSVAVTGAVLIGQFPEAAMVMVLFNLSEAIEARALDRARGAIRELVALSPPVATRVRPDGSWEEVPLDQVTAGERLHVRPGERVPLDGTVASGRTTINQAPITGESMPVEKGPGDPVYAGTINETGAIDFVASVAAGDTTLARIIKAVQEAQANRAPVERFVDAFARFYTPAVFALAILTAVLPPLLSGAAWTGSVYTALVLLVIGCPCALVISTPVTIVSGMAAATKSGILVKGGAWLEQARRLTCIAFDKTGTITRGEPRQTDFLFFARAGGPDEARARHLAASLAAASDHPVSRAIAKAAREAGLTPAMPADFTALPGEGVRGQLDGALWYLGSQRLAQRLGLVTDESAIARLEAQGKTVVALMDEGGLAALLAVADTLRPTSAQAVRELEKLGIKTLLLTGDNAACAAAIGHEAGVAETRAGLLPADKLAIIADLEKAGEKVGMVGDGINDAPALARADIGFAMAAGGTDTAIETADVAIMDDDARKVPRFIRLSRATHTILVENIALALGIKAVFFALAFTGNATMWMAVFADVGAALLVVGNGLRAARK